MSEQIKFPVSRLVGGSVYKSRPRESNGQPVYVPGSNPPVQAVNYSIGIAIPKGSESHWNQTPWGAIIWNEGATKFPSTHNSPVFSWKVTDGDSSLPNSLGRIPNQQEGYTGNWIVWASSNRPPQLCNTKGQMLFEPDAIYTGCYIQTVVNVAPNNATGTQKPGVYINLDAVCFIGHGARIETSAVNVAAVSWDTTLPAGASPIPLSPSAQIQQNMPNATVGDRSSQPMQPPVPNRAILEPPQPKQEPIRVLIGAAEGFTYEELKKAGWTDESLLENNMMTLR